MNCSVAILLVPTDWNAEKNMNIPAPVNGILGILDFMEEIMHKEYLWQDLKFQSLCL